MAIFRFLKMAAAAILDFYIIEILRVGRVLRSKCVVVPNFVAISQAVAEIWRFFDIKDGGRPPSWLFNRSEF